MTGLLAFLRKVSALDGKDFGSSRALSSGRSRSRRRAALARSSRSNTNTIATSRSADADTTFNFTETPAFGWEDLTLCALRRTAWSAKPVQQSAILAGVGTGVEEHP